jgi:PhnB protein
METKLNPYLSFRDNARQAMEFYRSVFGGKLTMTTFKEFNASQDPGEDDKIMHAMLEAENGITFMAADTPNRMEYRPGANISMSLSGDNEKELTSYFEKLAAGGQITMPLEQAPWGDTFGMCADRFGVNWMVNITAQARA